MKIYVIGLGPGGENQMTPRALQALNQCDLIVGYDYYVELIRHLFPNKEFLSTAMKKEVERCRSAVEQAVLGKTVSMISSGDAGIYGMAGVIHQVAAEYDGVEIEVVPGITAASSAAAVLGAPLTHDFAVISLSDLLTPWDKIEKRLLLAADADFVICLYNPSSKKRADYLQKACDLMLQYKQGSTPCGYVRNIGRDGECHTVCTLDELRNAQVDMFTTVIIGNSQTEMIKGKLVTPRGYKQI